MCVFNSVCVYLLMVDEVSSVLLCRMLFMVEEDYSVLCFYIVLVLLPGV
jgi:hypothetical protein